MLIIYIYIYLVFFFAYLRKGNTEKARSGWNKKWSTTKINKNCHRNITNKFIALLNHSNLSDQLNKKLKES